MNFTKTVLKNGLRIITVPQEGNPAVTVLVLVEAGSKYETKEINGVSHFLEHMCFKGTKKRPSVIDITSELDGMGSAYNAFTGFEYTGYYAKVEKSRFDKALDIVSDIYINPIFDPEEIDKEKGVIIEEINMYEDLPMRRVQEIFTNLLYGDQPAGWDIVGRKEIIQKLIRDDFIDYRNKHYLAGATVVVVAGGINEKDAIKKVEGAFKDIPTGKKQGKLPVIEKQEKPKLLVKKKDSDQTHLVLGVRAYDAFDKRRYPLEVLSDLLGGGMSSRLFQKIREEMGAAYYISAGSDELTDHGYFAASSGVQSQKLVQVVDAILKELSKLKHETVGKEELQKAKDHLIGRLMLGLETSDSLAFFHGMQEILTGDITTPEELIEKIKKVDEGQIKEVAEDIFQNNKLNLTIIGPVENSDILQSVLKIA